MTSAYMCKRKHVARKFRSMYANGLCRDREDSGASTEAHSELIENYVVEEEPFCSAAESHSTIPHFKFMGNKPFWPSSRNTYSLSVVVAAGLYFFSFYFCSPLCAMCVCVLAVFLRAASDRRKQLCDTTKPNEYIHAVCLYVVVLCGVACRSMYDVHTAHGASTYSICAYFCFANRALERNTNMLQPYYTERQK